MSTDTLTLRSPAECIASIPSLIGFEPHDSIIGIYLNDGRVQVTQRIDAEAIDQPEAFFGQTRKHKFEEVILVFWGQGRSDAVDTFIAYGQADLFVRDALWVKDGRWGSCICNDESCCPAEGHEVEPFQLEQSMGVFDSPPAPSREALADEARPTGTRHMEYVEREGDVLEAWRDKWIAKIRNAFWAGDPDSLGMKAGRALHDVRVRDVIIWDLANLDSENLPRAYEFACSVSRSMRPKDASPAASVAAICAYLMGHGAKANLALEYVDNDYSLGGLLRVSLGAGLPPDVFRKTFTGLTYDEVRNGMGG